MQNREVIVVTGLPRTGTSLCMRMLEAGGIVALTDGIRSADVDNPNGYYEFEPVKRTRTDASWVSGAEGKAVKMVYRLVYDLPPSVRYAVVFMQRDLDEVLESQRAMLTRSNVRCTDDDQTLRRLFERELGDFESWMAQQSHMRMLKVDFNQMMGDAEPVLREMNRFFHGRLCEKSMRQVLDHRLYRNRKASVETPA